MANGTLTHRQVLRHMQVAGGWMMPYIMAEDLRLDRLAVAAGRIATLPKPFQCEWLHLGTNCFSWWKVVGSTDKPGIEGLLIERVGGPYAVICLN